MLTRMITKHISSGVVLITLYVEYAARAEFHSGELIQQSNVCVLHV